MTVSREKISPVSIQTAHFGRRVFFLSSAAPPRFAASPAAFTLLRLPFQFDLDQCLVPTMAGKSCPGKDREASMISTRELAAAFALMVLATPVAAGATCARELAVTETTLLKAVIRLQGSAHINQAEKCTTYRTHADVVIKAREVFERCSTGRDREQDIGQMNTALSQAETAIASMCSAP
jgi:hypothetical protein